MRTKVTVSVPASIYPAIAARAAADNVSVPSWLLAAAEHALRLRRLAVEQQPRGLAAADPATRQAVAASGGRAGGRGRKKD